MRRYLDIPINEDLHAGRWEMVMFKHRHGIKCGYETSKAAMGLSLQKEQFQFSRYLKSVGKAWDYGILVRVLRNEAILQRFLIEVAPRLHQDGELLYKLLKISEVHWRNFSMVRLMTKYFTRKLHAHISFFDYHRYAQVFQPLYVRNENEAVSALSTAWNVDHHVSLFETFPSLWNSERARELLFRFRDVGVCLVRLKHEMTYEDYFSAMLAENEQLLKAASLKIQELLISVCLQTPGQPCLSRILHFYLFHSNEGVKERLGHLKLRYPELKGNPEIKNASSFWYRFRYGFR
jgi:hypothetical protein